MKAYNQMTLPKINHYHWKSVSIIETDDNDSVTNCKDSKRSPGS